MTETAHDLDREDDQEPIGTEIAQPDPERELPLPVRIGGRPSGFKPEMCQIVADMASQGSLDFEIAEELGISYRTFNRWRGKYPEFQAAMVAGVAVAEKHCQFNVERSLYQRATGYSYHSVKITRDGTEIPIVVHVPADPSAAQFWLTNRAADRWKNTKTVEQKFDPEDLKRVEHILSSFKALQNKGHTRIINGEIVDAVSETEQVTDQVPAILKNGHAR